MRALVAIVALGGCYAPIPPTGSPCVDDTGCPTGLVCSLATMTCERSPVPIDAAVGDTAAEDSAPTDAAKAYLYRRRITITNTAGSTLPVGFTIRVPLGATLGNLVSAGKVKTNYADLRVIGDGTIGERDRIVDPAGGAAPPAVVFSLAAPIAAGGTSTAYALHYGAPNASDAPENGDAVFAVFDEFESAIGTGWLVNDAPAVSGERLVLRANRTDALTTTATSDGVPIVSSVELIARIVDPTSAPTTHTEGTFYYWFGYQHTGDFNASDPWIVWIARAAGTVRAEQKSPVGCEADCPSAALSQSTAFRYYRIERDPGATRFYLDGALAYTAAVTNTTDYSVMVRNYMATSAVEVEWIRASARVAPDPGVVVAAEENL